MSPAIRAEVEDVLGRPKVRQKFKSLTSEAVAVFLNDLDRITTTTEVARSITVLPRDPKDEPYPLRPDPSRGQAHPDRDR